MGKFVKLVDYTAYNNKKRADLKAVGA